MRPLRVGDLIAREMEALIKNGFWSPGDILPSERELAQRFGVSRGSVREALRLLEAKGLRSKRSSPWSIPARGYVESAPWLAIFPSLAIFIAVLSFNLLGDALRDAFDPRTGRG